MDSRTELGPSFRAGPGPARRQVPGFDELVEVLQEPDLGVGGTEFKPRELGAGDPLEGEIGLLADDHRRRGGFGSGFGAGARCAARHNGELEGDDELVVGFAFGGDEGVLGGVEEPAGAGAEAGFFEQLAFKGGGGGFAELDVPAGEVGVFDGGGGGGGGGVFQGTTEEEVVVVEEDAADDGLDVAGGGGGGDWCGADGGGHGEGRVAECGRGVRGQGADELIR